MPKSAEPVPCTVQEYKDMEDDLSGWCTECQLWVNTGSVEPDAEGYVCDSCGEPTVVGAMNALFSNHISIDE